MPQPKKPAAKKPATKKPAPATAASVAVAELADEPREGDFRGVTLTLPAKLPATFAMDLAEVQATRDSDLGPTYRLIVGVIGPRQWGAIRDKLADDGDDMEALGEVFGEILTSVMAPYNTTPGESPASAGS